MTDMLKCAPMRLTSVHLKWILNQSDDINCQRHNA